MGVRVTDIDAKSQIRDDPVNISAAHEKKKKIKYLNLWIYYQQKFTPFAISIEGDIENKATALVIGMYINMYQKCKLPYSHVCKYLETLMPV